MGRDAFFTKGDLGGAFANVNHFLWQWLGPWENARKLLDSLSGTYKAAAQKWFELDASFAAQANIQAAAWYHSAWDMKKTAYDSWKWLTEQEVLVHAWDEHGNPYLKKQKLADLNDPDAPKPPGYEPSGYEYIHDGDGTDKVHNSTQTTYDSHGNLKSTDTTIDNMGGGFSYHEHTDYWDEHSFTTTVTHLDGSQTVVEVHGDKDGNGTKTVTNTDKDGKTVDTSSYTGTDIKSDDPKWTNNDPEADDTDGDGKKDKDDSEGSQYSNTSVGSTV
jgi:YD repeat-containing protein